MRRPGVTVALLLLFLLAGAVATLVLIREQDDRDGPGDGVHPGVPPTDGDDATRHGAPGRDGPSRTTPRRRAAGDAVAEPAAADATLRPFRGTVSESGPNSDDAANAPLPADAQVVVLRPAPPGTHGVRTDIATEELASAPVAPDGTFEVASPGPGEWTLVARGTGRIGLPLLVPAGTGGIDLRLVSAPKAVTTIRVAAAPRGVPIAGATVVVGRLEVDSGPPRVVDLIPRMRLTTDEKGEARVALAATEAVFVSAPGFGSVLVEPPVSGERDVWMRPGDRIAGVVRAPDGTPVAGARLRRASGSSGLTWSTGADGRFEMDGIGASGGDGPQFEVTSRVGTWTGPLAPGTTDAVIVVAPASNDQVEGRVFLPDGSPAAGAKLNWGTQTGADGRFRLDRVPAGRQPISATVGGEGGPTAPPGFRGTVLADVPPPGAAPVVVEIRLAPIPRSYAVIRVVDADGNHVPEAAVGVPYGRAGPERADAKVLVLDSPPGTVVRAVFNGFVGSFARWPASEMEVVTAATPDGPPAVLRLPALTQVVVEAGFDGPPLPLAHMLWARRVGPDEAFVGIGLRYEFAQVAPVAMTGERGTWKVDPTMPYVVSGWARGFARVRRPLTAQEVAAGRALVRFARGATVSGRLTSRDALVAAGVGPQLRRRIPGLDQWDIEHVARQTDDGRFAFDCVGPGTWSLVVDWPPGLPAVERVFELGSANVDLGDVEVPVPERLVGSVSLADGRPAGGAAVRFEVPDAPGFASSVETFVRADGRFGLDVTAGARGWLRISRAGSGTVCVPANAGTPAKVVLSPAGRLEVRIRLPRGRLSAWSVGVRTPGGSPRWQPESEAAADVAGFDRVELYRGLAPGPIVAVAEGLDWKLEGTATVVAGETTVVELDGRRDGR